MPPLLKTLTPKNNQKVTRVDFYILDHSDEQARLRIACRLAEKAWRLSNHIYIHATPAAAAQIDELLWSFKPDSFIPHAQLPASKKTPIHIGSDFNDDGDIGTHHNLLINIGTDVPRFFSRFERVAEIVTQQPQQLAVSRERFLFYKKRGYALESHHLK